MKLGIITSGGDAPGMNVAVRAVVRYAIKNGFEVYGYKDGYKGILENNFERLYNRSVSGLLNKGGTILGTSRVPEFLNSSVQLKAAQNMKDFGITNLIAIGGDGTYHGAYELDKLGINVVGIPGTIDNDVALTDFTLGFHTALNTINEAVDKLRDTSSSHKRCAIVEVMGRNCGDLAIYAGICGGAEMINTPENRLKKEDVIEKLKKMKNEDRSYALFITTEKMYDNLADFAHEITEKSGFHAVPTVLGYIQRGGSPSSEDRLLGTQMGIYAVELVVKGIHGVAVGIRNTKIVHDSFLDVFATKRKKSKLYDLLEEVS
ncbi:MAG: 6-phosphofructokinase [Acholeplasmatales bacterium]|jgi:6-phosphofructokinase 1|nr:6-phosphofructokinase [Acholeplasmatales bacterium]